MQNLLSLLEKVYAKCLEIVESKLGNEQYGFWLLVGKFNM